MQWRCNLTALYITSLAEGVGKTTICAGLAKHLLSSGQKVGFFKPIIAKEAEGGASDALFMKQILSLDEPVDSICPVISGQDKVVNKIREAYDRISRGKDVVIVEGVCERSIVEALDARAIIVEGYSKELSQARLENSYQDWGEYLLGIVLNKVPRSRVESVSSELSAQFGEAGIKILGVLPEDRVLFTISVGELARHLQGEMLNCAEKSEELVENLMLGAMAVDPGSEYFGRKTNKAVVVRGERPDMQIATLETSMRCLILSGNTAPIPAVRYRAEDKSVPIIVVKSDTASTVMAIENALDKARFNQEKKLPRLTEIMEKHFSFQMVYQEMGLAD